MPEATPALPKQERVRFTVTGDQYRLIMGALAAKETSFDIFEDDSPEGFWRPKHALGVLSEHLAPQYIAQKKALTNKQHDALARLAEVTLKVTAEQYDLIVDALASQADNVSSRAAVIDKALEKSNASAALDRQQQELHDLHESLVARQQASQKKATE